MGKIVLRKVRGGFYPADAVAQAEADKIPPMDVLMFTYRRPRNIAHHRKLFGMLNLVMQSTNIQDRFVSVDNLLDTLKHATGHTELFQDIDGQYHCKPKSIAFESMDQAAFEEFYNKSVALICEQIVPNLDRADLEREVLEMLK